MGTVNLYQERMARLRANERRDREIMRLHAAGWTLAEIAAKVGLNNRQRVHQILQKRMRDNA